MVAASEAEWQIRGGGRGNESLDVNGVNGKAAAKHSDAIHRHNAIELQCLAV